MKELLSISPNQYDCIHIDFRYKGESTLDVLALCLNIDGGVSLASDFVFFNSNNRGDYSQKAIIPFDSSSTSRRHWMDITCPVSSDKSVWLLTDNLEDEDSDYISERVEIFPSLIRKEVTSIGFVLNFGYGGCGNFFPRDFERLTKLSIVGFNKTDMSELFHIVVSPETIKTTSKMVLMVEKKNGKLLINQIAEDFENGIEGIVTKYT